MTYKAIESIFNDACIGNGPFEAGDLTISAIQKLYDIQYLPAYKLFWQWLDENTKRRSA